jgi:hypothetical protein
MGVTYLGNSPGMEKTKLNGLHVLVKKSIRNFERWLVCAAVGYAGEPG